MTDELSLKKICTSAYTDEDILEAKRTLTGTIKTSFLLDAKSQDVPSKNHLQDIIKIFKETNPNDMPTYVARNLSKLPSVIEHVDVTRLLKEISSLKNEVDSIRKKLETSERTAEDLRQEVSLLRSEILTASRNVNRGDMKDSENATKTEREKQFIDRNVIASDTMTSQSKDFSCDSEKAVIKPALMTQLPRNGYDERVSNADTSQLKTITTITEQLFKHPAQILHLPMIIKNARVSEVMPLQPKNITTLPEQSSKHLAEMAQLPKSIKDVRVSPANTSQLKNITTPSEQSGKSPARLQLPKKRFAKKISRYRPFHRPSPALAIEAGTQLQKMVSPQTSNVNGASFIPVDVKKSQTRGNLKKSGTASANEDSRVPVPNMLLYVSCLDLQTTAMVLETNRQKARHPQTSFRLKTRRISRYIATTETVPLLQARMVDYHRQSHVYTSPVRAHKYWERNSYRMSPGRS